jgi:diguanylate cyclase (GGDEF)-like protein
VSQLFSLATLFICTAITTGVVAVALTYSSLVPGREKATVWWCAAMWCVTVGLTLLALRAVLPWWLGIGAGNALVLLAYGLAWKGCTVFRGVELPAFMICAGSAVWIVLYFGVESIRNDFNSRIVLSSGAIFTYSSLMAVDAWWGWKEDRLPSFVALMVLFSTHALMHFFRAGVMLAMPAANEMAAGGSTWVSVLALENYVHAIGISFFFFALTKERVERRYRLAAEIDGLTGAATRRFFVSETRDRLAKAPKSGVLALIDLDFFKSVNDCYGHLGGDRVLQAFGQFVDDRLQPGMVFGRLGGEEFGLFLPDREMSQARGFLDDLRADVEAMQIPFMGSPIRITISIGAASVREVGVDFDHLMAAADGALYLAKEEGRNRLQVFSLSMRMHQILEDGLETRLGLTEQRLSRMNVRSRIGGA